MYTLLTCFECGKKLSSAISTCPHCGKNPHPAVCCLCERISKGSELVNKSHPLCLDNLKATSKECYNLSYPVCRISLQYPELPKACPQCGHPLTFSSCYLCKETIPREFEVEYFVYNSRDSDYWGRNEKFHAPCGNLFAERIMKRRVSNNRCKMCGKELTTWDKLFSREQHKECYSLKVDITE
jgi:ribosomal protein L34E